MTFAPMVCDCYSVSQNGLVGTLLLGIHKLNDIEQIFGN